MTIALDKSKILTEIPLEIFDTLDSTNNYLLHYARYEKQICLAEAQTLGRGQFDRTWYSPSGENLYFSLRYPLKKFEGLSLVISLAVINTIKQFAPDAKIMAKWPNDLMYGDKKLAGILVEIQRHTHVIIGIGLNINMQHNLWASLREILHSPTELDRNEICTVLIKTLLDYLQKFEQNSFEAFISEWNAVDYIKGKKITVQHTTGIAEGINPQGHLMLRLPTGKTKKIFSGKVQ